MLITSLHLHHAHDLLCSLLQHPHVMQATEIAQKLDEQSDVCHLVQQIRVGQLFRGHVAYGLLKLTCALAARAQDGVVDHPAVHALEVLHLVCDHAAVQQIYEALLDLV